MAEVRDRNYVVGVTAMVIGIFLALIAALWAHFTGLPALDDVGREIYPNIPRGWGWELFGQLLSLGGVFIAMGGATLAFLYERKMTWARSAIGAGLFTMLIIILFAIIPNEWLTYTQAEWEWTSQKIWVRIPTGILGGNEINLSAAVFKDIIAATYAMVATAGVIIGMIRWQKREELRATREKANAAKVRVSTYGRPLQKVER